MNKGKVEDYSPAEYLQENMPPTIILVGKDDSVTPAYQSKLFHKNMLSYNNESYLYIYDGVGHLFTPTGQPDDEWPKPDKKVKAKVDTEIELFLIKLKFIDKN
jgi:dipeptidyl aminopeptidase/acylaminoacyl peptidase